MFRGCQVNEYINRVIITGFRTLVRSGWEEKEGSGVGLIKKIGWGN